MKNGLRFIFDSLTCVHVNYSFAQFSQCRESQAKTRAIFQAKAQAKFFLLHLVPCSCAASSSSSAAPSRSSRSCSGFRTRRAPCRRGMAGSARRRSAAAPPRTASSWSAVASAWLLASASAASLSSVEVPWAAPGTSSRSHRLPVAEWAFSEPDLAFLEPDRAF